MENLFLLLLWFICKIAIGLSLLKILFFKDWPFSFLEWLGLSYGLGLGAVSIYMIVVSLLGMRFSVPSAVIWFSPMILFALFLYFKRPSYASKTNVDSGARPKLSLIEKFFIAAILLEILYAIFRALIKPMESYDAIAIYALKAKIFYLTSMVPPDFFKNFAAIVPHIEYPLLVPLIEAQFYTFFGSMNDLMVKMIFPLYYISLLAIAYSVIRRFLNRKQSLLFTFLLATIPQVTDFATNGYADFPFAFYCSTSFFYLYLWLTDKKPGMLILSFILSIFAIWTKSEGLLFTAINLVVIIISMIRNKKIELAGTIYTGASLLALVFYMLLWQGLGLSVNSDFAWHNMSLMHKVSMGFKRIPDILYEYQIQFFGPKRWNIIWILFIATILIRFKDSFSNSMFPVTLAIFFSFSGYFLIYMLSSAPQGIGWHLSTSCSRLFIHFVPIVILWLALMFKKSGMEL